MPRIVMDSGLELHEVEARFGLRQVMEQSFFSEWQNVEVALDERDRSNSFYFRLAGRWFERSQIFFPVCSQKAAPKFP